MIAYLAGIVRAAAATGLAMLPRRHWPAFEPMLPVSRAAAAASLLTLLAGTALGIYGFLAHLQDVAALNNEAYMQAALRVEGDEMPMPSGLSALALFTFILLTPQGWASTYLTVTGLIRSIGSQFDDPHGDVILTLADAGIRRATAATLRRGEIDNRRLLEGPEVRDRIARGAQLSLPGAELVVVASRIKAGWEVGAVVVSDRGAFRIVGVEDRVIDGRLRHLYSLARHDDLEVFRRTVRYDFPDGAPVDRRDA